MTKKLSTSKNNGTVSKLTSFKYRDSKLQAKKGEGGGPGEIIGHTRGGGRWTLEDRKR